MSNFLETRANVGYCHELAERLAADGVTITRTSTRWNRVERLADMLWVTWAHRASYDVALVDVFSGAAFLWAEAVAFALVRLGKPFVLTLHGGNLPVFAERWPRRMRRLLRSATRVTAPSNFMREHLRSRRDDIVLLPNAVDTTSNSYRERLRARPRLVWVRAFHEIYNPVLAVEVVALASRQLPELTLTMIGPDKEDGSLAAVTARARELGVAERIHITGRLTKSEIPHHLGEADVFVNTSNIDNTPISILEALSSGLCVVSTSVGGLPYLLDHEQTALLVPPANADAMADAIVRVVREPALAHRLSKQARTKALEHDWTRVIAAWEQLLDEVAG